MKNFILYLLLILVSSTACKKNNTEPEPKLPEMPVYTDSAAFVINGKQYSFTNRNGQGIGNRSVNLKPFSTPLSDRKLARYSNGLYWYGEQDSVLYSTQFNYNADHVGDVKFWFTKKYAKTAMNLEGSMWTPPSNSELFRLGKLPFAIDMERNATLDGIAIDISIKDLPSAVSSYIPGPWVLTSPTLSLEIQNNSTFEITKVIKLDDKYLVEAQFEMNVFDRTEKLYRVEKGFLRLITSMKPRWWVLG